MPPTAIKTAGGYVSPDTRGRAWVKKRLLPSWQSWRAGCYRPPARRLYGCNQTTSRGPDRAAEEHDHALYEAVTEAIAEWRGYRMDKAICQAYGMPDETDYLTGMVLAGGY